VKIGKCEQNENKKIRNVNKMKKKKECEKNENKKISFKKMLFDN
jgi:hypothetical protein